MQQQVTKAFLKVASNLSFPYEVESSCLLGKVLSCTQLLRNLPSKRMVCQATYGGQTVLVKLFFGASYKRRWQREVDGVIHIASSGVRTPELLEAVVDEQQGIAFAIFEFIDQADTLDACWQKASGDGAKAAIFKQALDVIATLHNSGVVQEDIHLNNFLIGEGGLYLIDGDQVSLQKKGQALSVELAIDNIALFFAQFHPWEDDWVDQVFGCYLGLRGISMTEMPLQALKQKVKEQRTWREGRYVEKKVFRACSEFNLIKNWNNFSVFSREIDEEEAYRFINEPDAFIERGEILKSGRSATVAKIKFAGKSCVVKRYNKKSTHHRLARSLLESRAAVSWRSGHLLRFNGISTAAPLLMLEQRFGVMRFGSYILTEYISGEHAANYFSRDDCSAEAKAMAEKVRRLIVKLHQSEISHGDLKSHNIWIAENSPLLIDLDGMQKNRDKRRQEQLARRDWSRLFRDLGGSEIAPILFKGLNLHI